MHICDYEVLVYGIASDGASIFVSLSDFKVITVNSSGSSFEFYAFWPSLYPDPSYSSKSGTNNLLVVIQYQDIFSAIRSDVGTYVSSKAVSHDLSLVTWYQRLSDVHIPTRRTFALLISQELKYYFVVIDMAQAEEDAQNFVDASFFIIKELPLEEVIIFSMAFIPEHGGRREAVAFSYIGGAFIYELSEDYEMTYSTVMVTDAIIMDILVYSGDLMEQQVFAASLGLYGGIMGSHFTPFVDPFYISEAEISDATDIYVRNIDGPSILMTSFNNRLEFIFISMDTEIYQTSYSYQLWRARVNCSLDSCSECMAEANPMCEWCVTTATCAYLGSPCDENFVLQHYKQNATHCPMIESANPSKIAASTANIDIELGGVFYGEVFDSNCSFGGEKMIPNSLYNNTISCPTPGNLEPSGDIRVGIVRSGVGIANKFTIQVKYCDELFNCTSCTEYLGCVWNLGIGSCSNVSVAPSAFVGSKCPRISGLSINSTEIGSPIVNVSMYGKNFVDVGMTCLWENGMISWETSAFYVDENEFLCELLRYNGTDSEFDVRLLLNTSVDFSNDTVGFLFYDCVNASGCGDCLAKMGYQRDCRWCASTGKCNTTIANGSCESPFLFYNCPEIDAMYPNNVHMNYNGTGYVILDVVPMGSKEYSVLLNETYVVNASVANSTHLEFIFPSFNFTGEISVEVYYSNISYALWASDYEVYSCSFINSESCLNCEEFALSHQSCGYCFLYECTASWSCNSSTFSQKCPRLSSISPSGGHQNHTRVAVVSGTDIQNYTYNLNVTQDAKVEASTCNYVNESAMSCVVPQSPSVSTGVADVSIELNDQILNETSPIEYTYWLCKSISTCKECMEFDFCGWCLLDGCKETGELNSSCNASLTVDLCPFAESFSPEFLYYTGGENLTVVLNSSVTLPAAFIGNSTAFTCNIAGVETKALVRNISAIDCLNTSEYEISQSYDYEEVSLVIDYGSQRFLEGRINYVQCVETATKCSECINPPYTSDYCSWCVGTEDWDCTLTRSCNLSTSEPFSYCPEIFAATPNFGDKDGNTEITIRTTGIPDKFNGSYFCGFKSEGTLVSALVINSTSLICVTPPSTYSFGSSIVRNETIEVLLGFRPFVESTVPFEYMNCMRNLQIGTCSSCVSAMDSRCGWCPHLNDTSCVIDEVCYDDEGGASVFFGSGSTCPMIDSISPSIASANGGTLITVYGSMFLNDSYSGCSFGGEISTATYVNSSILTCDVPFRAMASDVLSVQLEILWRGLKYSDNFITFTYLKTEEPGNVLPYIIGGGAAATGGFGLLFLIIFILLLIIVIILIVIVVMFVMRKKGGGEKFKIVKPNSYDVLYKDIDVPKYEALGKDKLRILAFLEDVLVDTCLDENSLFSQLLVKLKPEEIDAFAKNTINLISSVSTRKAAQLIALQVEREIEQSRESTTLFRANSISTKLFSNFCRKICLDYFFETFGLLVNEIEYKFKENDAEGADGAEMTVLNASMELDLNRMGDVDPTFVNANSYQLMLTLTNILLQIRKKTDLVPRDIRMILHRLREALERSYPDFVYVGVGSFYFLRMICPALVAPAAYGVLEHPPNAKSQRMLIMISKTLQNLGNETLPGIKEQYMQKINKFIEENFEGVRNLMMLVSDIEFDRDNEGEGDQITFQGELSSSLVIPRRVLENSRAFFYNLVVANWQSYSVSYPELAKIFTHNPTLISTKARV